jgi:predicted ATPase/DNA-binding CsgD family transcriptional regulator
VVQSAAAAGSDNLPVPLTSFVGRAGDLERLEGLLGRHRLVTVTGSGGSGKTRVAVELARRLASRFDDGVRLVELASLVDPAQVPGTVAAALGVREQPGRSITQSLQDAAAAGRHLLVVLDNCEHLVAPAAELCEALLEASADLRVLATSREPLRITGEVRYPLGPLPVPGGHADRPLDEYEAVALFVNRAQQVDPHFDLTQSSTAAVAQIVQRLDGMPLAIELAAARVGGLGVDQVRDRLDDRFRLLIGGSRTTAPRHRSLFAAIDWSYRLLTATQQRVFRCLSVFPAPFTSEGAQAVAGIDALNIAPDLVERSLLVLTQENLDGHTRFGMLDTLRAHASDRLAEGGDSFAVNATMSAWAVKAVERVGEGFDRTPADQRAAALWFDAEYGNLRHALNWSLEHDPLVALRLAAELARWWHLRGRYGEGRNLLEQAIAGGPKGPTELVATAMLRLGRLAYGTSDYPAALEVFAKVVDLLTPAGPSGLLVDALIGRSNVLRNTMRLEEAEHQAHQALGMAETIGYAGGQSDACTAIGMARHYAADYRTAHSFAVRAHSIDQARLRPDQALYRNMLLTVVAAEVGAHPAGERACLEGLALARQVGDRRGEAFNQGILSEYCIRSGRLPEAAQHLVEALHTATVIGDRLVCTDCIRNAARVCAELGDFRNSAILFAAYETSWAAWRVSDLPAPAMDSVGVGAFREIEHKLTTNLDPAQRLAFERRGAIMSVGAAIELAESLMSSIADPEPAQSPTGGVRLSLRERELVTLLAAGLTDQQIGEKMFISIRTVRSHLDRIRDKTGRRRRAELTRLAVDTGLI